jgi:hypothetical protein
MRLLKKLEMPELVSGFFGASSTTAVRFDE